MNFKLLSIQKNIFLSNGLSNNSTLFLFAILFITDYIKKYIYWHLNNNNNNGTFKLGTWVLNFHGKTGYNPIASY